MFSNLAFYLGKRWEVLPKFLQKACVTAEKLGDRRSVALIELHLGRVFYFGGKRNEALTAFFSGEQFELLFTAGRGQAANILKMAKKKGLGISAIGEIIKGKNRIIFVDKNGRKKRIEAKGYKHF